jgi:hypothetical protein
LIQFLRAAGRRSDEMLPMITQNLPDAEEYARRTRTQTDALWVLSDANAGLGMLRREAGNDGW